MDSRIYIADCRYFEEIRTHFGENRIILPSIPCGALPEATSCHPDMVLCPVAPSCVVCAPEVFRAYHKLLSPYGIQVIQGESRLRCDYPGDIAYNVLITETCAFSRTDRTDRQILRSLQRRNLPFVTVAQGYARCSALSFGKSLITADPSVCQAGRDAGFSVLSVAPGHILLPGYDYGFIGGASGLLEGNTVCFFGELKAHPDGEKIRKFIENQGFFVLDIPNRPLLDVGTILCIEL